MGAEGPFAVGLLYLRWARARRGLDAGYFASETKLRRRHPVGAGGAYAETVEPLMATDARAEATQVKHKALVTTDGNIEATYVHGVVGAEGEAQTH